MWNMGQFIELASVAGWDVNQAGVVVFETNKDDPGVWELNKYNNISI